MGAGVLSGVETGDPPEGSNSAAKGAMAARNPNNRTQQSVFFKAYFPHSCNLPGAAVHYLQTLRGPVLWYAAGPARYTNPGVRKAV